MEREVSGVEKNDTNEDLQPVQLKTVVNIESFGTSKVYPLVI